MDKPDLDLNLLHRAALVSDGATVHRLAPLVGIYKDEHRRYDGWAKLGFPAPYTQPEVVAAIRQAEQNLRNFMNRSALDGAPITAPHHE